MANSSQARKRARQTEKRTLNNASQKSAVRTSIKKVLKLVNTDLDAAKKEYNHMVKLIDRIAGRDILHKNQAARIKSRLNKKLKLAAQ